MLTDLYQVQMVFVHAVCHLRAAERAICCDVNALLVAPLEHSVIPPVGVHLYLNTGSRCVRRWQEQPELQMHLLYTNHTSFHSGLNWAVQCEQMHHAWGEPVEVIGDVPIAYTKMSRGSSKCKQLTVGRFTTILLLTVAQVDCRACEMQVQKELRL